MDLSFVGGPLGGYLDAPSEVQDMLEFGRERRRFSASEYLTLEESAAERSEFYRGDIYAMTGETLTHNRIINNLVRWFGVHLESVDCEVYTTDVRLRIEEHDVFTYPDLMLVCGEPKLYKSRQDTVEDATLIVEVLSPSTKEYDRGPKSGFYRALPSLKQILLVSQSERAVENSFRLESGSWMVSDIPTKSGSIEIPHLGLSLALEDIYRGLEPFDTDS